MPRYNEFMKCLYDLPNDRNMRLGGSIIRYLGVPKFVQTDGTKLHLWKLPLDGNTPVEHIVEYNHPGIDISSIEVGYYNDDRKMLAGYARRIPNRGTVQGLRQNALRFVTCDGSGPAGTLLIESSPAFANMLTDNYPSLSKAWEMIHEERWSSVAISKDVALERQMSGVLLIYYKTTNIAYMPEDRMVYVKKSEFQDIYRDVLSSYPWKIRQE